MLKLALLVVLVLLALAVVRAVTRRGPGSGGPGARRAKAAADQAVIGRQGHNQGWSGGGGA